MNSGIYVITAPSGNQYIGSAFNFTKRWNKHKRELASKTHHNEPLQKAYEKYSGFIVFEKLLCCATEDLLFYEQLVIDAFKPTYNLCRVAGSKQGWVTPEEVKTKMRLKALGKKHTIEARQKMSATRKGRKASLETRHRISEAHKIVQNKPERLAQASVRMQGNKYGTGYVHTVEHKNKISLGVTKDWERRKAKK